MLHPSGLLGRHSERTSASPSLFAYKAHIYLGLRRFPKGLHPLAHVKVLSRLRQMCLAQVDDSSKGYPGVLTGFALQSKKKI